MSQRHRRDGGWVSVELALITPVLLFLVSLLIVLLAVATQRVNFVATLRECAIAASHLETQEVMTNHARASLPGLRGVSVRLVDADAVSMVTLSARLQLPPPLTAIRLQWLESAAVVVGQ